MKIKLSMMVILSITIFSCQKNTVLYEYDRLEGKGNHIENIEKDKYLKLFSKKGLDTEKIYFIDAEEVDSIPEFVFEMLPSNSFCYYTTYLRQSEQYSYLSNIDQKGCNRVINSIANHNDYNFKPLNGKVKRVFDEKFLNNQNKQLELPFDKKVVTLVYSKKMGNLFFKDAKRILASISNQTDFDYIVLVLDFV
jgi:hypothetical protein